MSNRGLALGGVRVDGLDSLVDELADAACGGAVDAVRLDVEAQLGGAAAAVGEVAMSALPRPPYYV
jgi:hypothetical protein